ncbi:ATP-binding cassette sub-family G member 1 [Belonocnema kinseyi]|uniref:ATP-binding cassette sub-family G member 1 n=1 Tax=Belonocnema kinseyi TaxID=2817044 RepID=UPI00143D41D8|nr:ATP-binding cassette sub-family G member 1 [Belonocnema kinseyi]XP_033211572.1 ATP-binding cassette sub-family G member 1 [Belonocnema kinseyi]
MYQRSVLLSVPKSQSIDIEFKDLDYTVQVGFRGPKKQILKEISGSFKSGELSAIMGPSGSGKSSLLNILTGLERKNVKGKVSYIHGKVEKSWNVYKKQACYILQDDQLNPLFSVNEVMRMAADLKLGHSLNSKGKQMVIDDVLETLDLLRTKDTRCDKLSGGQRKRLSIALELVDNPPVVFLDEPTTGLDSLSSIQCVFMLKSLARSGRTIVCTIHQPSAAIYDMFDHVYMLADGRCMYQGAAFNTVSYFGTLGLHCPQYHNPADYAIEVVSGEHGDFSHHLSAASEDSSWRSSGPLKSDKFNGISRTHSQEGKTTVLITSPSEFTKFLVLVRRCTIQLYRDWTVTHLKLLLHFLVGALLGALFTDSGSDGSKTISNIGFLIATSVYLCYTSMMPAVLKFPSELPVLRKEHFNNWYKLRTYYAAFIITNTPVQMVFAIVYSSISYYLSSQPMEWFRFLMFASSAILTTLIAESFGLVLGTTVNPVNGTFLGAISVCAMLIFAGFLVLYTHMTPFWYMVSYLSYLRYSMEAMVSALYGYGRETMFCPDTYCHYRIPQTLINELGMKGDGFWFDMAMLTINTVVLQSIAYCTLKRKLNRF